MSGFINTSSGGGGGGSPTGPAGGDLGGTYPNPSVLNINGVVISGTPSSGQVITASGPLAASWQTPSGGFVAGGDLSGTATSQNVINIHGVSVPVGTGNAIGNGLYITTAGAGGVLAYSALNLAGGSNFVTGTLPIGNQASQTMGGAVGGTTAASTINLTGNASITGALPSANQAAQTMGGDVAGTTAASTVTLAGDVTGRSGVTVVGKISGSTPIAITPASLSWLAATVSPGITQATPTTDVATNNITITPQAPFASASTNKTAGSLIVALTAPISGGSEAYSTVTRGGTTLVKTGALAAATTFGAVYLGGATDAALAASTTILQLGRGQATVEFVPGGNLSGNTTSNGWQFGAVSTQSFGGGTSVIGLTNATVNPTSNPSGGVVLYSELTTGALKVRATSSAVTTLAANTLQTINSQSLFHDGYWGVCETVSSATPTTIMQYATTTGKGGFMTLTAISRATATAGGITAGNVSTAQYVLAYQNISGTATLSTGSNPTLVSGTNQTTLTALSAPVLAATASGNIITITVTNVALTTIDSECFAEIIQC